MRLVLRRAVPAFLIPLAIALLTPGDGSRRGPAERQGTPSGGLALPFVVNQGQTDRSVRFYAQTPHGTVLVTDAASLIYKRAGRAALSLTESPVTDRPAVVRGLDQAATRINIFRGNDPARWQRNVSTYDTVTLGEVFHDIELTLHASATGVEKIFTVAAGANPGAIRMRLERVSSLAVNSAGELVAGSDDGEVRFSRPVAFQERDGRRNPVDVAYTVDGSEYGFQLGEYDRSRALIIDPAIVSTFLGGEGTGDSIFAMRHDGVGHIYVTGWTDSPDLPGVTSSSPDPETGGCHNTDAFVAKIDDTLGTIISATFLGGSFGVTLEAGQAIAMNPAGEIYVAGYTVSGDFPGVTSASPDASLGGGMDGFVVRLDNNLSTILAATYVGGSASDRINALNYDNTSGTLYAAGSTNSGDFPLVACSNDCTKTNGEGFIIQLDTPIASFMRSTFLGGSGGDEFDSESVLALAVDQTGNLYAAGRTDSADFPYIVTSDTTFAGPSEAFVIKFAPNLIVTSGTFFGSTAEEEIITLAVVEDGSSYALFAAGTVDGGAGPGGALPGITLSVADPHQQGRDGFVTKFDALLNVVTTTYVGGSSSDSLNAMAIPAGGSSIFVGGGTSSSTFPAIDGLAADTIISNGEMFVVRLSADLTTIEGGTYVGGSLSEFAYALAVDPSAGSSSPVWVAGSTASGSFPGVTSSSADSVFGGKGGREGVIARLPSSLKRPLAAVLAALKDVLVLLPGPSDRFRELTHKLALADALARRQNWQAATNQMQQFVGEVSRLAGERRLTAAERARLLEASGEVIQEINAAREEDDAGKRRGPASPHVEPEPAPSCPVLPPTRFR